MDYNYATQSALNRGGGGEVSYLNRTCPVHHQNIPEDEDVFPNRKTNPCRKEWSKKVVPPYLPSKIHANHSVFKAECSRWAGQMTLCNKKRRRVFSLPSRRGDFFSCYARLLLIIVFSPVNAYPVLPVEVFFAKMMSGRVKTDTI